MLTPCRSSEQEFVAATSRPASAVLGASKASGRADGARLQAQDALNEIARQRPRDLFKPLRVHFIGEDGIDAGGVKKEFFQLLITELLCPDYGMLVFQPVRGASAQELNPGTKDMKLRPLEISMCRPCIHCGLEQAPQSFSSRVSSNGSEIRLWR